MLKPTITRNISIIKSGKEFKLFHYVTKKLFRISPIGAHILRLCNGKNNIAEIEKVIKRKYKVTGSQTNNFIIKLKKEGLVE